MQPQEPFASLGLSAATTPTSPSTRRLPSAQLPTSAASVSFQTNGSKTIPQLIASEASHSSGMSSSVASANTDASSVVSQQNPFDNVVVPTTGSGGYGASPQVVSSLSYNSQITDSSSFATGAGLAVNPHLRLPPATPPSAHAISGSPTHLTTPVQLPVSLSVPSSPSYEHQYQQQQHTDMMFDDDENTAPSSAANTEEQTNTISRFVENTKRRINQRRDSADEAHMDGALIAGYLQKLGRNGKWQTRWFETDGECLSYYKSSKRSKLLATLDLEKVGIIEIDTDDKMEYSFRIQVLGRLYHLRADSRASCRDWVITLNRVKEARLHQGNVKLVGGASTNPLDLLHTSGTNSPEHQGGTPRVVVVSNRERTRAVDEDEHWDQLIRVDGPDTDPSNPSYISQSRRSAISTAVVARWTKRHSTFQRLGTKLTKWARSLKKYSCGADMERDVNSVYLDRHVHPPGHDDNNMKQQQHPISKQRQRQGQDKGLSGWMDKESSASAVLLAGQPNPVDLVSPSKPIQAKDRSVSVASSDFDARTIS